MEITQRLLKSLLHYNPKTGVFTWLRRPVSTKYDRIWNTQYAGKRAGSMTREGHRRITIKVFHYRYAYFRAARLAWLYMTGELPINDIDHINYDPQDDRFSNLRPATRSQNNANSGPPKHNTSGKKGVCWDASRKQWKAEICKDGKKEMIGRFSSFEDACKARRARAIELFGEFARED